MRTSEEWQKFFQVGKRYLVRWGVDDGQHGMQEGVVVEVNYYSVTLEHEEQHKWGPYMARSSIHFGFNMRAQQVPDPSVQLAGALVADAIEAVMLGHGPFEHSGALVGRLREIVQAIRPPSVAP